MNTRKEDVLRVLDLIQPRLDLGALFHVDGNKVPVIHINHFRDLRTVLVFIEVPELGG
jgi:hypothetical protein